MTLEEIVKSKLGAGRVSLQEMSVELIWREEEINSMVEQ